MENDTKLLKCLKNIKSPGVYSRTDEKHAAPTLDDFSKVGYRAIVSAKRKEFVMKLFDRKIEKCFNDLRQNAEKMLPCHYEASFEVPEHYDCDKVANVLKQFFEEDLGYAVVIKRDMKSKDDNSASSDLLRSDGSDSLPSGQSSSWRLGNSKAPKNENVIYLTLS